MMSTEAEETNQVVQDLHLLFATDDQLCSDLEYVCNLLSSPEKPPTNSPSRTAKTSKKTSSWHLDRRKREILELRRQVDVLKGSLLEAQQLATGKPDMSVWERAARDQVVASSKSISENEKLRAHVVENATFIEEMVETLRKKPRLSLENDEVIRDELIQQPDGRITPERVYHVTLAAPFRLIGAAVWKVFNGEHPMKIPDGAEQTLEAIDQFTVYQTFRNAGASVLVHANMIYKYYVEVDREVIVWRSVLEDALMPHMTEGAVQDKWGWLVVAPTANLATCRVTFLHQVIPTHKTSFAEHVKAKNVLMKKYAFIQPPDIPGTFPGGAVNEEMEIPIPFAKKTFLDRDKEMELTLKRVIDQVVFDFQKSNLSP
ncbi:hypothetical protein Ae201684_007670 [Aphanomyces euteiches]|uniref:START domain-containing protein n=1 Tax=Aphanomyces euteiches TaxID=100861 RepID=A0A6G0X809_9STRA|nr:hypothetical protein Ae201684_007670 [Aphanomyces euteiches]